MISKLNYLRVLRRELKKSRKQKLRQNLLMNSSTSQFQLILIIKFTLTQSQKLLTGFIIHLRECDLRYSNLLRLLQNILTSTRLMYHKHIPLAICKIHSG